MQIILQGGCYGNSLLLISTLRIAKGERDEGLVELGMKPPLETGKGNQLETGKRIIFGI